MPLGAELCADKHCIGCRPDPALEAYAFVFPRLTTNRTTADDPLGGLRAAIGSIRLHDRKREIAIIVLERHAMRAPPLLGLQRAFAPVRLVLQPPLAAWHLTGNFNCHKVVRKLAAKLEPTPPGRVSLSATSERSLKDTPPVEQAISILERESYAASKARCRGPYEGFPVHTTVPMPMPMPVPVSMLTPMPMPCR